MSDDHIIPQQMIRKFANANGELRELHKPSLRLGTRWRKPKGILFGDDYYMDLAGNLDEELLKRVEQNFARYYPLFAAETLDNHSIDGEASMALIDWLASLLSRTSLIQAAAMGVAVKHESSMVPLMVALRNDVRQRWYEQMRDMMTRSEWKWRNLSIRDDQVVVLTDNPVVLAKVPGARSLVVIAPLTDKRILFGGLEDTVEKFRGARIDQLNRHLAAWAESRIFSSSTETLEQILGDLRAESGWAQNARQPFNGFVERIKTMPGPRGDEASQYWEEMLESLGPSMSRGTEWEATP